MCTNENVTFSSPCDLAQWNCERRMHSLEEQILVHVGACRNTSLVFTMQNEVCPSTCPRYYKPVCDSDGTTFKWCLSGGEGYLSEIPEFFKVIETARQK